MKPGVAALTLALAGCAHTPGSFQIRTPETGPAILAPRAQQPVLFTDVLNREYNLDFHEGYVDLRPGMALRVQTARGLQTDEVRYRVLRAFSGLRVEAARKPVLASAKRIRFYYAVKLAKEPGQPYHPSFIVWAMNEQELLDRSSRAQRDPATVCGSTAAGCIAFKGKVSVSPEILITAQAKPRYVLLTATVQDVLRADKIQTAPDSLRISRHSGNAAAPVVWDKPADAMRMPLIAGDRISW
jgi:hypothetical protein